MYKKLDKVLALVAKTGDKIIVVSETHDPCVVMSLKDYDYLITGSSAVNELTEDQLLDKLNRDIAVWKSVQDKDDEYDLEQFKVEDLHEALAEDSDKNEDSSRVEAGKAENHKQNKADVDDGSVEEEDRYYIEPVE